MTCTEPGSPPTSDAPTGDPLPPRELPPWAPLLAALERRRPPLPRFTSPCPGPGSVFAVVLLVALPVVILTGLLSYVAYGPRFGQAIAGDVGVLHLPWSDWPASPSWFCRLAQGVHVGLGLVLVQADTSGDEVDARPGIG